MFELIERTGDARAIPARYPTYAEATAALARRAGELRTTYRAAAVTEALPRFVAVLHDRGITVACLRGCARGPACAGRRARDLDVAVRWARRPGATPRVRMSPGPTPTCVGHHD